MMYFTYPELDSRAGSEEPEKLLEEAVSLADKWQNRANSLLSKREKTIQERLVRLLTHPSDKIALTRMIDQSFRSRSNYRVADQVSWLLKEYGVPTFFSLSERTLAFLFRFAGKLACDWMVPRMIEKMRADSSRAVIRGEIDSLHPHLRKRKDEGVRMNINHLGEAVLGEEEALDRLRKYVKTLGSPEIEYISIKLSTIYSQMQPIAFEHTMRVIKERLSVLYRAAQENYFIQSNGKRIPKFVNLDMEEYRDLAITTEAFKRTLDEEEFKRHSAGIVLQAYIPDSYEIQRELTAWARRRVEAGGNPIKLRIVKGANMEMEQVESALHNWPLAPYDNKLDVDANYKRMVDFGMEPHNIEAVHLGIASHNLFELAYAFRLAVEHKVTEFMTFEMLEGMADHIRRAIQETSVEMLLYAPVAAKEQFINAIAYLIRRLDENTTEENFLRYAPDLRTSTREWAFLKERFIASYHHKSKAGTKPHRTQNRLTEVFPAYMGTFHKGEFQNEPDTDWSLATNRKWAESIRETWGKKTSDTPMEIPLVLAGREIFIGREVRDCGDPSLINERVRIARYAMANEEDVKLALQTAKADPDGWRVKTQRQRHEVISRVAMELRKARGDLIGVAAADTGKVFSETDVEVSEAIDFAEYYPLSAKAFTDFCHIKARGKGVGLVISPWNFPIAIPCGGIVASLAAGNTVVFKPASDAVISAWVLCQCFWKAGVSKSTLQFLPCSGALMGEKLTKHPAIDYIILTGGTDTGLRILEKRPEVFLSAETGGKNATIVTGMSDRDQAIKNVVYSAFGNCGQKCSATSLLILEREVYEDPSFRRQLVDAAKSLKVGSAWDFENVLGPVIRPPLGDLKTALTKLDDGESWVLEPQNIEGNPHMWTPGIKWGVKPNSYSHMTEFFGPILSVMRAENLDRAIELANMTGYGLTSGIESLDTREIEHWKEHIRAGNLYINRGTTGAVTLRQPFGGMGKSALGAGIKAGGPDYVAQFMDYEEQGFPETGPIETDHSLLRLAQDWNRKLAWGAFRSCGEEMEKTIRAIKSYLYRHDQYFLKPKDYFHLRGQDNILRYLPAGRVVVRLHEQDGLFETLSRIAAARICGSKLEVSVPQGLTNSVTEFLRGKEGSLLLGHTLVLVQTDRQLIQSMPRVRRIRYAAPDRVPEEVFQAAAKTGFYIARTPVVMEGRIELLHYFQQQSICDNYHRYGNLGERALIK
jgi:RHH-type proline utilization regulon transcriptional repressor/proline dehydrogenase/delta 1-pyrroline-5-carboxylate dehydrogenase